MARRATEMKNRRLQHITKINNIIINETINRYNPYTGKTKPVNHHKIQEQINKMKNVNTQSRFTPEPILQCNRIEECLDDPLNLNG